MFRKRNKEPKPEGDLFSNVKCLLVVGRLLFLFPCDGFCWKSHQNFTFRRNSIPTAVALLLITWYLVKDIISLKFLVQMSHGGVVGYAQPAHYFVVSGIITCIYIYCFLNSHKLKLLFASWENATPFLNLRVSSMRRITWSAVLFTMIPAIMINSLLSIDAVYRLDGQERIIPENFTRLEYCYERLLQNWHSVASFSPQITLVALADFVYGSLPRAFTFPLIITFSCALLLQFKDLYELGIKRINKIGDDDDDKGENGLDKISAGEDDDNDEEKAFWTSLVKRHNGLTELVTEFDDFLSPLIFISYFSSLYLICMQLLRALSSSLEHVEAKLNLGLSPFLFNASFLTETCILYVVSISAAQLNDYAHKIGDVLRRCPLEYQTSEILRLENRVNSGPRIGFTGLGCFVITKPFLLAIAKTVITLEIVLLQAQLSHPPIFKTELFFQ